MRITPCWSPHSLLDLLNYSIQHSLGSLEPPRPNTPDFPSLSGSPPTSETLDSAGSALSTKFRKPLATSNHYFRKRERAMHGGGGGGATTKERKRTRERTRHTQKQGEISDFSYSQSLHYDYVHGPISLIHNEMIVITNSKRNHWPRGLLRWIQQHTHSYTCKQK